MHFMFVWSVNNLKRKIKHWQNTPNSIGIQIWSLIVLCVCVARARLVGSENLGRWYIEKRLDTDAKIAAVYNCLSQISSNL